MLDDKDDVPIDNSHQEEVMVMKMARKIEGLTCIFGSIRLVANNQNVRFTNNFFNKGQRDGDLTLHTAVGKHKITNRIEVFGNQRTAWEGFAVGIVGTETECVGEKKRKRRMVISLLKNGPKAWIN